MENDNFSSGRSNSAAARPSANPAPGSLRPVQCRKSAPRPLLLESAGGEEALDHDSGQTTASAEFRPRASEHRVSAFRGRAWSFTRIAKPFSVPPQFTASLGEGEYYAATLFLYVTRQGVPGIWPAKMPDPDGRQNALAHLRSRRGAAGDEFVAPCIPNMNLGAYEVVQATDRLSEPQWPELPFTELLRIAFKDRIIDRPDHSIVQKLRGLA